MTGLIIIVSAAGTPTGSAIWWHKIRCVAWEAAGEWLAGIRTGETMALPAAWQAAYSAALPWATVALCVSLVAAVITGNLLLNGGNNR